MKTTEIYPNNIFYTVTVNIEYESNDNGKSKKSKETYLVDAKDISDAELKTISIMESVIGTWEIISVTKAHVSGVVTESE